MNCVAERKTKKCFSILHLIIILVIAVIDINYNCFSGFRNTHNNHVLIKEKQQQKKTQ